MQGTLPEIDRRSEFLDRPWQQGSLLDTPFTRRLSEIDRARYAADEARMCFVGFSSEDQGKGRILLFVFASAEECAEAVAVQNRRAATMTQQFKEHFASLRAAQQTAIPPNRLPYYFGTELECRLPHPTINSRMRIKIKQQNPVDVGAWYNNHVGSEFEVIELLADMIPKQYKVDISRLVSQGIESKSTRGIGYVIFADAEVLQNGNE